MAFNRGDIVETFFDLPYSKETKLHPCIIISNQKVYDADEMYICVMMSTSGSESRDVFTFEITKDMLMFDNKKVFSQARCHLVTYVQEKHIANGTPLNTLKYNAINRLVTRINAVSFEEEEI